MVKISKFLAYLLFFLLMSIVFFPKTNLFYLVEKELAPEKIYISNEKIESRPFGLDLREASLSYEGVQSMKVKKIEFLFLLFYNSANIEDIKLSSIIVNYWPQHIQSCKVEYMLFTPLMIKAIAKGDFGNLRAELALKTKHLKIFLKPSKIMLQRYKKTLHYFKKLENGEYLYEKTL